MSEALFFDRPWVHPLVRSRHGLLHEHRHLTPPDTTHMPPSDVAGESCLTFREIRRTESCDMQHVFCLSVQHLTLESTETCIITVCFTFPLVRKVNDILQMRATLKCGLT